MDIKFKGTTEQQEMRFRKRPTRTTGCDLRVAKTADGKRYRISIGAEATQLIMNQGGEWFFDIVKIEGTSLFGYTLTHTVTKWQVRTYNKGVACFEKTSAGELVCDLMNAKDAYEVTMSCTGNVSTESGRFIFLCTDNL